MPTAIIDGISTRYEVIGSGPPLLMFAPAGFDASMEKWRTTGVYTRIKPLDHLPKKYSCIVFDRRETRPVRRPRRTPQLGALRRARQRPARSSRP